MAVYVDRIHPCRPSEEWPFTHFCRMTADTPMQLQEMANKLYLKRSWYHANWNPPHYKLNWYKRKEAIDAGAIEINARDVLRQREAVQCSR